MNFVNIQCIERNVTYNIYIYIYIHDFAFSQGRNETFIKFSKSLNARRSQRDWLIYAAEVVLILDGNSEHVAHA